MKVGKYLIPAIFFALIFDLKAQTLRGTVRDADNGAPLTGATVALQRGNAGISPQSIATGLEGAFVFEGLRPAYYRCTVSMVGYETQTLTEIIVAAGKEQTLDIALAHSTTELPRVTITAPQPGRRPLQPLSEIPLTRDQTLRFPSTYFDPGRLAAAYPGVAQTDDGINGMSIRGNSPASVRWRLEGVEIVNPNHLPNAGTFSDRPAAASGGVPMFSAQLLDNSSLMTGVFPAGYGDALGGIMDMNLRKGNTNRREFTVQAGLIGLDLAAEGPLAKGSKNSYLVNYRYSTVGLLEKMGVPFGDEKINFQDLSFNLSFNGRKGSRWTVFGMGGLSENLFDHKAGKDVKQYKDLFDINFHSKTGVLGVTNWTPLGTNTWLKISLAASSQVNDRTSVTTADINLNDADHLRESKVSGAVTFFHRLNLHNRLVAGATVTGQYYMDDLTDHYQGRIIPEHQFVSGQPWVNYIWSSRNNHLLFNAGLHALLVPYINKSAIEPRLTLTQVLSDRHRLSISWGQFSQVAPLWLNKSELDLLKAWHAGLRYTWAPAPAWAVKAELFWQHQSNLPASDYGALRTWSVLNATETTGNLLSITQYSGLGENKGLELSAEHYLQDDWFLAANATIFNSRYQGGDKIWHDTRWNLGHLANFTLGKEWYKERAEGKIRAFGLNGRVVWTGGFREMPIDTVASLGAKSTIYNTYSAYTIQLPDYFRIDLRIYWKRSLGNRRNSTFAMDFQNVTNQQNVAYHYYDPFTKKIETKHQLGLIPGISWRLEF
jgi:hypothetical protein